LLFQIVIARLLRPGEYAIVAFAIGAAGFIQALTIFGIPQVITRYVPEARLKGRLAAIRTIVIGGLALHVLLGIAAIVASLLIWSLIASGSIAEQWKLLVLGSAFTIVTILYVDAETTAQALMLQTLSSGIAIAEPLAKLCGVILLTVSGQTVTATEILCISTAATGLAAAFLVVGALTSISRPVADRETESWPDIMRKFAGSALPAI